MMEQASLAVAQSGNNWPLIDADERGAEEGLWKNVTRAASGEPIGVLRLGSKIGRLAQDDTG
jgi:hypothetical protein